ncbi:hypothetical protein ABZ215_18855 [Amycolatopsis sp. NPDC006131]|uniref:hypothetical protein n=1 Tax=Amycolatopsis sp. NPDC006131 TaxID=3156731 RepID=UPI0033BD2F49
MRIGWSPRSWFTGLDRLDAEALIRGCSGGFTVLVLGGLAAPLAARVPVAGQYWLGLVALVAFGVAGVRIGQTSRPALQGVCAAVGSYVLVLPLVVAGNGLAGAGQVVSALLAAAAMGGGCGLVAGIRRRKAGA